MLVFKTYQHTRRKLQGRYPLGFGFFGLSSTASPDDIQFYQIDNNDIKIFQERRKQIIVYTASLAVYFIFVTIIIYSFIIDG